MNGNWMPEPVLQAFPWLCMALFLIAALLTTVTHIGAFIGRAALAIAAGFGAVLAFMRYRNAVDEQQISQREFMDGFMTGRGYRKDESGEWIK